MLETLSKVLVNKLWTLILTERYRSLTVDGKKAIREFRLKSTTDQRLSLKGDQMIHTQSMLRLHQCKEYTTKEERLWQERRRFDRRSRQEPRHLQLTKETSLMSVHHTVRIYAKESN